MNRDYIPLISFFVAMGCIMTIIPILAIIKEDVYSQCVKLHGNSTYTIHECYMNNAPFPLNVDTSNWHIWRVK